MTMYYFRGKIKEHYFDKLRLFFMSIEDSYKQSQYAYEIADVSLNLCLQYAWQNSICDDSTSI